MTHISPAAILSWSLYSVVFECFLLTHLYKYDKFKCLKWSSEVQPGAFKRLMTYSYLSTVPLAMLYSIGFSIIKYDQGFIAVPGFAAIPKPYIFWPERAQMWIVPLYFILSLAWALEIVTHLEEFCFWLFLLNQGPTPRNWFKSFEFRTWLVGSLCAVAGIPLAVGFTKNDPLRCEAWTFLSGSIGSTAINILFLYIIVRFPSFLRRIEEDGADDAVIARLASFHRLNVVRVIVRFFFTLPLFALGLDGVRQHEHPLNENLFGTDLFVMVGGLACIASSAITLLIFFPHTPAPPPTPYQNSYAYYDNDPNDLFIIASPNQDHLQEIYKPPLEVEPGSREEDRPDSGYQTQPDVDADVASIRENAANPFHTHHEARHELSRSESMPSQRREEDIEMGVRGDSASSLRRTSSAPSRARIIATRRFSTNHLHPYIYNYTSPIDVESCLALPKPGDGSTTPRAV